MASGKGKKESGRSRKNVPASPKKERSLTGRAGTRSGQREESVLDAALSLYRRKQYKRIVEEYAQFDSSLITDMDSRRRFLALLAFSLATSGNLADAETAAMRGLELNDTDKDFYYVLAFINTGYKNHDLVIEYCQKYINSPDNPVRDANLSRGREGYLYNYLGLAQAAKNDPESACKSFMKAIEYDPTLEHAYLNLAGVLNSSNRTEEALKWVEKGLKKCRQVQELRMMKKNLENRVTISACMIVKDEEELLPGCLSSIRDWVDEIIIVDTGSTDRTVEIAREYGADVYFQEWANDFSAPRNLSLQKAACDWILVIDADEEFVGADVNKLRTILATTDSQLISVNVENINPRTGETSSGLISVRLFRNSPDFRYEGIVHNQLKYPEGLVALPVPVTIKHYGYNLAPEKMRQKLMRSRRLLEKQLEERPDFAFAHFNMAQLLRSLTDDDEPNINDKVIYHAERVIELTDKSLGIHLQAHHQAAFAALKKKDLDTAEKFLTKALKIKPDYLDAIFTYGQVYIARKNYDKAQRYMQKYLDLQHRYGQQIKTENMIQMYIRARHIAYYYLGLIQYELGNKEKAAEYFANTLAEQEPYRDTYIRLAGIYLEWKEPLRALPCIEKELVNNPDSDMAHLYKGGALMYLDQMDEAEACFLRALELTRDRTDVFKKAGCFLAGRKRYDDAIAAFGRWTDVEPKRFEPWHLKATAAYEAQDYNTAIESYRRCLELEPGNLEILNDLANCYFKLGDFVSAEVEYSKALETGTNLAIAYRNLGLTKIKLGKNKDALAFLTEYMETAPDDFAIEKAVADLYIGSGDFASAIQHLEKVLRNNPADIDSLFAISECYHSMGHIQSAQIGYSQILKINPGHRKAKERMAQLGASLKTV
jgi:tetratricopeptide (TPR) repeat protein